MVTAPMTSEVLAVYEAAALHIDRFVIWRLEGLDSPDSILLPLRSFFRLTGLLAIVVEASRFRMPNCAMTRPLRLRPQSLSDDGLTSAGLRSRVNITSSLDIHIDIFEQPADVAWLLF